MKDVSSDLNQRIAERIRDLRASQQLSLDALAERSGVSRSMISLVERGETSATAVVLERLATGLGVVLASLFEEPPPAQADTSTEPVARRPDQSEWKDPESGYVRRNVSPAHVPQPMQIVEVRFPAGQRVAFETGTRDLRVFQQIWMLEGNMVITVGSDTHRLSAGDCLAMELDRPTMFHNPARRAARYAVVMASEPRGRR